MSKSFKIFSQLIEKKKTEYKQVSFETIKSYIRLKIIFYYRHGFLTTTLSLGKISWKRSRKKRKSDGSELGAFTKLSKAKDGLHKY